MAFVLWEVRGVRVRASDGRRALVDRSEAGGAHLEFRELVIIDVDSVSGVAVAGSDALPRLVSPGQIYGSHYGVCITTHLCDNLRIGFEVQQPPCKFGGGGVVVGLGEHTDGAPQSDLKVSLLQIALREVRGELQAALDVIRILLGHSSALNLEGNTQEIFARQGHQVAPLA